MEGSQLNLNSQAVYNIFEQGSTYLNLPEHDWKRKNRMHYPDLFNFSQIVFAPPAPLVRVAQLDSYRMKEKRHYPQLANKSYLDDYF